MQMEERDVTWHTKFVTQLVTFLTQECDGTVTQPQLVTKWRSSYKDQKDGKSSSVIPYPSNTTEPPKMLTKDECDRLIISLFMIDILKPKILWSNPYSSHMYIGPGVHAHTLLQEGSKVAVKVKFPIRGSNKGGNSNSTTSTTTPLSAKSTTKKRKKSSSPASNNSNKWLSTTSTSTKKKANNKSTTKTRQSKKKQGSKKKNVNEIIELDCSSSSSENSFNDDDFDDDF